MALMKASVEVVSFWIQVTEYFMEVVGASIEDVVEASIETVNISEAVERLHDSLQSPTTYMDLLSFAGGNGIF